MRDLQRLFHVVCLAVILTNDLILQGRLLLLILHRLVSVKYLLLLEGLLVLIDVYVKLRRALGVVDLRRQRGRMLLLLEL